MGSIHRIVFVKLDCPKVSYNIIPRPGGELGVIGDGLGQCTIWPAEAGIWRMVQSKERRNEGRRKVTKTYQARQAILTGGVANFFLAAEAGTGTGGATASVMVLMAEGKDMAGRQDGVVSAVLVRDGRQRGGERRGQPASLPGRSGNDTHGAGGGGMQAWSLGLICCGGLRAASGLVRRGCAQ